MKSKHLQTAIVVLSLLVICTQRAQGVKSIPNDTDIGRWDSRNRIYTLTSNVYEAIYISENNLILDGNGHMVIGSGVSAYGYYGVNLYVKTGITIKDLIISGFDTGIFLIDSSNNTIVGNTVSENMEAGIMLSWGSDYNTVIDNTVEDNYWYGIILSSASNNQIYNNSFISNDVQVCVQSQSYDNVFNLDASVGGNYWSDWTVPDEDDDGFVDFPYINLQPCPISVGMEDNLPWSIRDGWRPEVMTTQLVNEVIELNLQQGITNSLDAKLNAVKKALEDFNENNDGSAVNALSAFISAVEIQSGSKIPETEADALINKAQRIIDCLST
jgi:parallel beta-helix repeat protein